MAPPSGALSRTLTHLVSPSENHLGRLLGRVGFAPHWSNPISPLPRLMLSSSGQAWRPLVGGITVVHLSSPSFSFCGRLGRRFDSGSGMCLTRWRR